MRTETLVRVNARAKGPLTWLIFTEIVNPLAADALLTFFLLSFADTALLRLDQKGWSERGVPGTISGAPQRRQHPNHGPLMPHRGL